MAFENISYGNSKLVRKIQSIEKKNDKAYIPGMIHRAFSDESHPSAKYYIFDIHVDVKDGKINMNSPMTYASVITKGFAPFTKEKMTGYLRKVFKNVKCNNPNKFIIFYGATEES